MYGNYIKINRTGRWMTALGIGLCVAILCCTVQMHKQAQLRDKILRLHVVADSDRAEDQAVKLRVRDAVLAQSISRVPDVEEMQRIEAAARQCLQACGSEETVRVSYTRMYFETREYPGFSLPAGSYDALRVVIGEGKGKNWWCVVYPSLCTDLAAAEGELTEDELALIRKEGKNFLVRFKIAEWIGELSHMFFES